MAVKTYLVSGFVNGLRRFKQYQDINEANVVNLAYMDGFSQITIRQV
ncbi:hypothetical protein SNR37_000248 [Agarivorans aestuarii]|uniref:Uncharacterized protein n=1 Tax=Agarivorans aestuarii TaxID=1563703 RepID=A0ABU7G699_9ALTE|nr:hypothetical protein [Agarivorans aestuarii]MEE1674928.1 hypothetical protein [Agarivorans aestuarii]